MPPKSARPAREPTGTFLGTGGCSPRLPGGGRWERAWPSGERALRMTRTKEPRYTGALARAQKPVSWRSSAPSLVIPLLKCAPNLPKNPLTSKPKGKQSPGSRENPGGLPSWPDCHALQRSGYLLGPQTDPWEARGALAGPRAPQPHGLEIKRGCFLPLLSGNPSCLALGSSRAVRGALHRPGAFRAGTEWDWHVKPQLSVPTHPQAPQCSLPRPLRRSRWQLHTLVPTFPLASSLGASDSHTVGKRGVGKEGRAPRFHG